MTLQDGEVVYTADLMNISPSNDAQIYGIDGDYIISGLELKNVTKTSVTLTSGRAILQGRLFELKRNTTYSLPDAVNYLGLAIDLSQVNTESSDGVVTNTQFTVTTALNEYGDTLQGDIQAFIGLYKIDTNLNVTQLVFKHDAEVDLTNSYGDVGFPSLRQIVAIKRGKNIQVHGAVTNAGAVTNSNEERVMRVLPVGFRPKYDVFYSITYAGRTLELIIHPNGNMALKNFSGSTIASKAGWFNLSANLTVD